jgi:hypothetical protein
MNHANKCPRKSLYESQDDNDNEDQDQDKENIIDSDYAPKQSNSKKRKALGNATGDSKGDVMKPGRTHWFKKTEGGRIAHNLEIARQTRLGSKIDESKSPVAERDIPTLSKSKKKFIWKTVTTKDILRENNLDEDSDMFNNPDISESIRKYMMTQTTPKAFVENYNQIQAWNMKVQNDTLARLADQMDRCVTGETSTFSLAVDYKKVVAKVGDEFRISLYADLVRIQCARRLSSKVGKLKWDVDTTDKRGNITTSIIELKAVKPPKYDAISRPYTVVHPQVNAIRQPRNWFGCDIVNQPYDFAGFIQSHRGPRHVLERFNYIPFDVWSTAPQCNPLEYCSHVQIETIMSCIETHFKVSHEADDLPIVICRLICSYIAIMNSVPTSDQNETLGNVCLQSKKSPRNWH